MRNALLACFLGFIALDAADAPLAGVDKRPVTIFCDGVRMAADLFSPKGLKPEQKLPALILCNGTGGTKAKVGNRTAPSFARAGFIVLSFDYRGWGESDSKLITLEAQPRPDAAGNVKVEARAVRWVALIGAIISFALTLPLYAGFQLGTADMQFVENSMWIERFNVNYHLGVDGISFWFVLLTAFINVVVVIAGWEVITHKVNQYMASFLILSGLKQAF
ncbi:MAG: hypothetical protein EBR83_10450, partial [Verrucomicrobia bacterium]|nr:hypothetical protein [Verrucomicrobiota bacterium]